MGQQLRALLSVLGILSVVTVYTVGADEQHQVDSKTKPVTKNDAIDFNDEEATAAQSITVVGNNIVIKSKVFKPPTSMSFLIFPKTSTHVDVKANPDGLPIVRVKDTASEIQVQSTFVAATAGAFPLSAEGNLGKIPAGAGGGGSGGGGGIHWSAKVGNQKFDLIVHNGQNGPEVSEEKEETVGAFSVANLNNTDSDEHTVGDPPTTQPFIDKDEDGSNAANQIANEKDMIKVIIKKVTSETIAGSVTLEMTGDGTKVKLWKKQTKEDGLETDREWTVASLPDGGLVRWIEGLDKSGTVRDIDVVLKKKGAGGGFADGAQLDKAKLTFVWTEQSGFERWERTYVQLTTVEPWKTAWKNVTDPPKGPLKDIFDGTGLKARKPVGTGGFHNVMVMKFKIEPQGVENEPGVKFDVSRQRASNVKFEAPAGTWHTVEQTAWPSNDEDANDDSGNVDESKVPNADHEIFVFDPPGLDNFPLGSVKVLFRANYREYLRVRFDGQRPTSGGDSSTWGARCSPKYDWHVIHTLIPDGATMYKRDTGDAAQSASNEIKAGHISLQ